MERKSYNLPNHVHFLTFSCYRRQQLLTEDFVRMQLLNSWDSARREVGFAIWSYVIMPEHVHLLVYPHQLQYQIAGILRILKEPFSRWLVRHWNDHAPHFLGRITVRRGGRVVRRFWQEGGGYDRNLFDWGVIERAAEYIEWNPVRRGLVSDSLQWKWSSARARAGLSDGPLVIDPIDLEVSGPGDAL